MTWEQEKARIAAAADPADVPCIAWGILHDAYLLATHQETIPAPAGWEFFSYGGLPLVAGCKLPDVTTRGTPWVALAALAAVLGIGALVMKRPPRGMQEWS